MHGLIAMNDASGSCMVCQQRKMPEASDKGSQPYSYPLGGCEMAGKSNPPFKTLPLGKGQEQKTMSPT